MSMYVATGLVTDETLNAKADAINKPTVDWSVNDLFDFITSTGLEVQNALEHPKVREFMRDAQIKVEEVKQEEKRRKTKKSLLVWGAAAAGVGFLLIRRKR